jgi:hypothetical protein
MHKILNIIKNFSISLFFTLVLAFISIPLTSYTIKGKSFYIQEKEKKNQIDLNSIIDNIDSYTMDTRNNTTYLTIYSSLSKDKAIATLMELYFYLDDNTYPLQVIFHTREDYFFASVTPLGISVS